MAFVESPLEIVLVSIRCSEDGLFDVSDARSLVSGVVVPSEMPHPARAQTPDRAAQARSSGSTRAAAAATTTAAAPIAVSRPL